MNTCLPTDRLMQTLRVHTPGATDDLLTLELFNVMDEFFRRTSAWVYKSDITLLEDITEYGFVTPSDTAVVRLMGVSHQNIPVPSAASTGVVQTSVGTIESEFQFPDGDVSVMPTLSDSPIERPVQLRRSTGRTTSRSPRCPTLRRENTRWKSCLR